MFSRLRTRVPAAAGRPGRHRLAAAVSALVLTAGVAACGSGSGPADSAASTGPADPAATVRVAWSTLPTQLDPAKATVEPVDFRILNLVYDRLLSISPTGDIEPMLATAWEYTPDGLGLDLTLREGVAFRDGTPLDAAAVVANLERVRTLGSTVSQR